MRKRQTMEIIETFGHYVENLTDKKPQSARRLLKTGWEAQNLKFRYMQDKRLMPADRHLANLMMDTMLRPLQKPEDSVIVSIFTPCEMMQEVGLHPYNVEGFSCYLSASKAERAFLQQAENQGIAETLCSYHKTFLGAAQKGLLPKPKCIVYTNLTCDANLLTFRTLADFYQVPVFAIDVPWNQTTENVQYVADQLKDLKIFLEKNTGKTISEDRLKERLACSKRTLENYKKYQQMRADRYVPSDLVTPLYAGMTNNILLGTAEEEKYTQMLLENIKKAPAAKGKHIYWMHTIPFWSDAVRQELCFSEKAQIVGCELAETCEPDFDPEKPFEEMKRVLKKGGKMVVWDMEAAEEPLREIDDKIENMRDPSHTRILSREEFEEMFKKDFALQCEETTLVPVNLKSWMELTDTSEDVQEEITNLMKAELEGGRKTGFSPYNKDSQIMFDHRWLLLIGVKK